MAPQHAGAPITLIEGEDSAGSEALARAAHAAEMADCPEQSTVLGKGTYGRVVALNSTTCVKVGEGHR